MKKVIALEFGSNMFGKLKPEIKQRLQAVIDNPCQETWEDAYTIILNAEGKMTTLWQAVIKIDWNMPQRKGLDEPWPYIPSSETIKEAINLAIFKGEKPKNWN
jgi:hypothetical protein